MYRFLKCFVMVVMVFISTPDLTAKEKIFAGYFDILVNSAEGTEVTGRIHLERNKDVLVRPIPKGYNFKIIRQDEGNIFRVDTRYDLSNRIMGVLTVDKGKRTPSNPADYKMTLALEDNGKQLETFDIKVRVVEKTLWQELYERYTPTTLKNTRLYGRMKYSDKEVAEIINDLKNNHWKFRGLEKCYSGRPQDYSGNFNPDDTHLPTGTIEYDWEKVVNRIGGLGYSYAKSKVYGPNGVPEKRKELRNAICNAILTYTSSVPVEGNEVLINNKPIGDCTGDGFGLLEEYKLAGIQTPTHQWVLTDPLVVPVLYMMPDLLEGMKANDDLSMKVHNALIRYLQIFFSEVKGRRRIEDPDGRWGEIQDTIYSSGAWADANLGHRSRTMLALPIIWADYNRPLTYVQYWYSDYYHDIPFKDFSYSPGWSPKGVVEDVSYWMTKYNIPSHRYKQSGFHPDGTVSHHIGNATDAAMVAYGFEWLTSCNSGYAYFKDTDFKISDSHYQFQLDRLLNVYPKLFYKQRMDCLVSGRSFLSDLRKFVNDTYLGAVRNLMRSRSHTTRLEGADRLKEVSKQIKNNTFEYSGTDAYWVNEFLVHRRGENEQPFYASLKLKSERTVGAEDFDRKVRKSWNMGYGILMLKVDGDEYADNVMCNFDWHALPGLTEEWRTSPLPAKGGAQASLPGLNKVSGVLSDGIAGMGIYHHLTKEKYSSATAYKTYHFIEDKIMSIGSGIARLRSGENKEICTFIEQTAMKTPLAWCLNGEIKTIVPGEKLDFSAEINKTCWLHHGEKGYVVMPVGKTGLRIKAGTEINITDKRISNDVPGFIIAIDHGINPENASYCYVQIPNVSLEDMPAKVKELEKDIEFNIDDRNVHAVYSDNDKTWQYGFFNPGKAKAGDIEVKASDIMQVMLRDNAKEWILSVNNPAPDGKKQKLTFEISKRLPEGKYLYKTRGMHEIEGEYVEITDAGNGSRVTVELPDIRDAKKYNYQSDLYAASPIVIAIPK